MTTELHIVSRDVVEEFDPEQPGRLYVGKHTGYMLVEKNWGRDN